MNLHSRVSMDTEVTVGGRRNSGLVTSKGVVPGTLQGSGTKSRQLSNHRQKELSRFKTHPTHPSSVHTHLVCPSVIQL